MFGLGAQELTIILVIVLVLFGGKRLPQLGEGLGRGIRNFKKGLQQDETAQNKNKIEDSSDDEK